MRNPLLKFDRTIGQTDQAAIDVARISPPVPSRGPIGGPRIGI
jgi:hypothetical protein